MGFRSIAYQCSRQPAMRKGRLVLCGQADVLGGICRQICPIHPEPKQCARVDNFIVHEDLLDTNEGSVAYCYGGGRSSMTAVSVKLAE